MHDDEADHTSLSAASMSLDPAPADPVFPGSVFADAVSTGTGSSDPGAADLGRVLHSDPHDFAGLYIRHRSSFTLQARHYLRDARDADEVVQEAFLRLFLALPELETELQALAYCRRTITNLCIDRYRAQARRPQVVDIATVPLEEFADEEGIDPVVRAEDAALVRTALSMLSPLHRAALVKREIEEKTLPVIAEELDVPEDSVKHLLFRARRALRRLLSGTSLAPGGDLEGAPVLGAAVRAGSGGLAAFVLLLVLGLSSGPNLQAIPVVGVDLPDLIGVGSLARTVGHAVTDAVDAVSSGDGSSSDRSSGDGSSSRGSSSDGSSEGSSSGGSGATVEDGPGSGSGEAARAGAVATRAPAASAAPVKVAPPFGPGLPPSASPAPVTVDSPEPAPDAPAPGGAADSASPSASPSASDDAASAALEPAPTTGPPPAESPSPSASASPSAAPLGSASDVPAAEASQSAGDAPATGRLVEGASSTVAPTAP